MVCHVLSLDPSPTKQMLLSGEMKLRWIKSVSFEKKRSRFGQALDFVTARSYDEAGRGSCSKLFLIVGVR